MKRYMLIGLSLLLLSLIMIPGSSDSQETSDLDKIIIHSPEMNETVRETTPLIEGTFNVGRDVDPDRVTIIVDGNDVSDWDEATTITENDFSYAVVSFFELLDGNHTVNVSFYDVDGNYFEYQWMFKVDTTPLPEEEFTIAMMDVLIILGLVFLIVLLSFIVFLVYLKIAKNFNISKFLKRHPPDKRIFVLYVPLIISILILILGLLYINENQVSTPFAIELLFVFCFFIGGTAFAIDAGRDRKQVEKYEHAFSQLLFELADAMRGGINPAKAIVEISETDTSIFRKHLRIASKNILTGRPFEEVLHILAKPTRSEVVRRYTTLIGEASKVGGQISIVVHRAAKDMDDLIKVKLERQRQLQIQMLTVYIAFVVLVVVAYLLIDIYPEVSTVNFGVIMNFNLEEATSTGVDASNRMSFETVKRRFYHLILLNSVGSGLVIGKLLYGKIKYGLIHCLIMGVVATLVFYIGIF